MLVLIVSAITLMVLSSLVTMFSMSCLAANKWDDGYFKGYEYGYEMAKKKYTPVYDRSGEKDIMVPNWFQDELRFGSCKYGDSTIKDRGCGLVCLAMMLTALEDEVIYPTDLAQFSDSFLTNGFNDQDRMCKWASENYDITWSGEMWGFEKVRELLDDGYLVMVGMQGKLGNEDYESHVVLFTGVTDDGKYIIHDPASIDNTFKPFEEEKLSDVTWGSINGLKV